MIGKYIALVNGFKVITLLVLIIVDFVLGVIVSLKAGTFSFKKLASFLNTSVLGMVGGYFLVGVMATVEPSFTAVVTASWVAIDAALLAMIVNKLKALGIPVPAAITKLTG